MIRFDAENKPGVSNLLTIHSTLTGHGNRGTGAEVRGQGLRCAEDRPRRDHGRIRRRRSGSAPSEYLDDPETLDSILAKGAEKARAVAAETLAQAYDKVGFLPAKH